MTLVYIIFAAWLAFAAHVLWWALTAKSDWKILERYPRALRSRMLLMPSHRWRHEIHSPSRQRVTRLVAGLRWRYAVLFFILPTALVAASWLAV